MARKPQARARAVQPPASKLRTVTLQLPEEMADMIDELAGALGITNTEVVERAVSILASEMTKMALVMPAWMTEDEE